MAGLSSPCTVAVHVVSTIGGCQGVVAPSKNLRVSKGVLFTKGTKNISTHLVFLECGGQPSCLGWAIFIVLIFLANPKSMAKAA